jgi:alpha-2-macroglobulin-like protein
MSELFKNNQRYQSFLSTDKPIYKLGDTVYIRNVFLNGIDLKPILRDDLKDYYFCSECKILGPKGDTVSSILLDKPENSTLGCKWLIPNDLSGGEYKVKLEFQGHGFPSSERSFEIRAFQNPRMNSQIEFLRKGYGAVKF